MSKREIPAKTIYVCDGCKDEADGKNRPKYWTTVKHLRDAYDFQGNACAADNIELELCAVCTETFSTAVNDAFGRDD